MKNKFKSKADDREKLKELVTRQLPRREREATEHTPSRGQTKPDNHTDLPKAHHNWKWKALGGRVFLFLFQSVKHTSLTSPCLELNPGFSDPRQALCYRTTIYLPTFFVPTFYVWKGSGKLSRLNLNWLGSSSCLLTGDPLSTES